MEIAQYRVVVINYTARDASGEVIDSSDNDGPIRYIHGTDDLIPGLEKALEGKKTGDQLQVEVSIDEAYGERDESLVEAVPRENFRGIDNIEIGMQFQTDMEDGSPFLVTVVDLDDETVTVDGNHPLAGKALSFELEVIEVREATAEEIEHGHVHVH